MTVQQRGSLEGSGIRLAERRAAQGRRGPPAVGQGSPLAPPARAWQGDGPVGSLWPCRPRNDLRGLVPPGTLPLSLGSGLCPLTRSCLPLLHASGRLLRACAQVVNALLTWDRGLHRSSVTQTESCGAGPACCTAGQTVSCCVQEAACFDPSWGGMGGGWEGRGMCPRADPGLSCNDGVGLP